ncbi:MAG: glycosyltransferase family 25 protein [Rhodobacteraceae bacterium]|nr:glycosyltransferase family 25 protein [Paracoccaceae bacterium]
MKSYIIHLAGDTRRQINVPTLLAALPNAAVVDAINGPQISDQNACPTRPGDLHEPSYPFPLGPGEIGCFLSHRACWQRIIDSGDDYGLIAEDDLAFDPINWAEVMDVIQTHATADMFIRMPAKQRETPVRAIGESGSARLFLPRVIGLQTVCQVVGRNAAIRLLAASETLDRPVDTLLQMHWITGQPIHTVLPNGVLELTDELGGSTIQKKTRTNNLLMREIKRFKYRSQVKMRPQKP